MSEDPGSTFAGLLAGCISDCDSDRRRGRETLEGALLLLAGAACSILTSYLLAAVGVTV